MGTVVDRDWLGMSPIKVLDYVGPVSESFDSSIRWPECASVINTINDQSNCGSCFSFSAG